MIVLSDTSPLRYLVLVEYEHVLPALYTRLVTTPQVMSELSAEQSPAVVRTWLEKLPPWLEIREPREISAMPRIDLGEASAISLAHEYAGVGESVLVLLDDLAARREATLRGLDVQGTLGVLLDAHQKKLIDVREAIARLRTTNFRASDAIYNEVLRSVQ